MVTHVEQPAGKRRVGRAYNRRNLLGPPDEELPLLALRVGILRSVEATIPRRHLPVEPAHHAARRDLQLRQRVGPQHLRNEAQQQPVVVEHLLKVGHLPPTVDGVAMEAAAELVVDAACGHPLGRHDRMRTGHRVARAIRRTQQQFQAHNVRKLWRAAKAPVLPIGARHQLDDRPLDVARIRCRCASAPLLARNRRGDLGRGGHNLFPLLCPGPMDALQHLPPARPTVARIRREVGAGKEGLPVWHQEDIERPPALLREQLTGRHVDPVHIRPLLAVHLHRNEMPVLNLRDRRVLERLMLHHVAPVTGRIADRDQQRLALRPCPLKGLVAPRKPVHRVARMLPQIEARLFCQSVGHVAHCFFGRQAEVAVSQS